MTVIAMKSNLKHSCLPFLLSICLCCFSLASLHGQEKARRNSIELVFTPLISKTDFKNLDDLLGRGVFSRLYNTHHPDRPILGYYYGLSYKRLIGYKWKVGIGFEYAYNGQQSRQFFSINGVSDEVLNSSPDYGGSQYKITYKSYSTPLSVEYRILQKNKWSYWIRGGGFLNIYSRIEARSFNFNKETGKREIGSLHSIYFHAVGSFSRVVKKHLEEDLWRLGFFIGGGVEYEMLPFLSLKAMPEFRYYGNLKRAPFAQLASGDIINIGCRFSLGLHF